MTTHDDKTTPQIEPEYVSRQVVADLLGVHPDTVTRWVNKWAAAGIVVRRLGPRYQLASVREAAIKASRESY